jgi:3-oxoacyl-[acyl-carrier protein] reductase
MLKGSLMNLGIDGRKALVCASSRGLGRACAQALAEAGCEVVINGRDEKALAAAVDSIRSATGVTVTPVQADVATPEGQAALLRACPAPDILVNNNAGPPMRDFRELTRQQMIDGVVANMIVPIELIQKTIGTMMERSFGRIINITSGTVKLPQAGLDLSSGARGGLSIFLAGVARQVAPRNVTINSLLPGAFATGRLQSLFDATAKRKNITAEQAKADRIAIVPADRLGDPAEFGATCAFLCSVHAGYITGQSILLDGGAAPITL